MPTIITGTKDKLIIQNTNPEAQTGRWCKKPLVPDLCYKCFDPKTLAHYKATGFREDEDGWRYGTCKRCRR